MNITKKLNLELILISMIPISAIFSIFFLELSLLIITSLFLIDIFKKKILQFLIMFFQKFLLFFICI